MYLFVNVNSVESEKATDMSLRLCYAALFLPSDDVEDSLPSDVSRLLVQGDVLTLGFRGRQELGRRAVAGALGGAAELRQFLFVGFLDRLLVAGGELPRLTNVHVGGDGLHDFLDLSPLLGGEATA